MLGGRQEPVARARCLTSRMPESEDTARAAEADRAAGCACVLQWDAAGGWSGAVGRTRACVEEIRRLQRTFDHPWPPDALLTLRRRFVDAAPPPPPAARESRPTAAVPMENPYCSCKLTCMSITSGSAG